MSRYFTQIRDGKRGWSEEGIRIIQKRLNKEDSRAKFIDLKSLLEDCLCSVGFEKHYVAGSSSCSWSLITDGWEAYVSLFYETHCGPNIIFTINREVRPLRDILPLWGILRDSYYEN